MELFSKIWNNVCILKFGLFGLCIYSISLEPEEKVLGWGFFEEEY